MPSFNCTTPDGCTFHDVGAIARITPALVRGDSAWVGVRVLQQQFGNGRRVFGYGSALLLVRRDGAWTVVRQSRHWST